MKRFLLTQKLCSSGWWKISDALKSSLFSSGWCLYVPPKPEVFEEQGEESRHESGQVKNKESERLPGEH